ncbi:crossover junction endodeoxyribonuclease RuvC [Thermoflexus sp.]|uniref:crossover junction endodeoxyribonuclease RuvC n=1 Tax=Thermoflexus sp. TaxID=1969742 RepID=UPI0025DE0C4A|nr:crossover junction endodeoxyribonuclease RuvC [Thermoflexus sp.]MDW8065774.1 crossover junction endodeoxyribonuclease RuvC [Anaerolineae bacterium]MCS6963861.1 crossover junction endodeoxyribonuclease RuvC [Thermoflexus sp.]MCS7350241.1 crossover junction endodeoxyribonuclease RuvC [Thermoflexus sp.]MCX7691442.1 crossover junction endodeoxyribonuclease RuvC [Thermoflexus sp.]MDW8179692.1 crossover junction endodeoxyribonuclease RuvC [Anaerolineae bacterium]
MRVLGIDPGIAITGYGLVEDRAGDLEALAYGDIRTPAEEPLPLRLRRLYEAIRALLQHYQPDVAAVERVFFGRNVTTAFAVGQARGVALLALAQAEIPVYEYTPADVKQALVGYGSAPKAQIQAMVRMLLRLPEIPRPDDVADALAVAICHLNHARLSAMP